MFTGIIQAMGKVVKYDGKSPPHSRRASAGRFGGRLWIRTPFRKVRLGESISIEGVCLTVAARVGRDLAFDVGKETRRVTTLGTMKSGRRVNLERALRVGDRLGGHWVSGHVEETGRILKIEKTRGSVTFTFYAPNAIRRYAVPKGSLSIDGISLTVAALRGNRVRIMIIPHTLSHTTLQDKKVGDRVNMEPDLLAKYALR
jgi:riboflavin synthase